ncbi:MAG: amino acid ABC transporter ATP-binding protein [Chloroflexi bacterium]|nr:amino acid ABC transporter ATP-binding protein [Chloroflexota bacterium]
MPLIQIKQLTKRYGENVVLDGISLDVDEGEVVVFVGPSGTGKTTLLYCTNLLVKPEGGEIWFDGQEITTAGVDLNKVRQRMGMVFQEFNLFNHLTALDNVRIGLTKVKGLSTQAATERAQRELEQVGLSNRTGHYPGQLSGGQKQRVAIARALAMDPKIMLFDEPTSALDPELIGEVLDVMLRLAKEGMTMMVVTHEMGFASEVADRLVFMEAGRIVEQGPPQELIHNPQVERTGKFLGRIGKLHNSLSAAPEESSL